MNTQSTLQKSSITNKYDELILVVKRDCIFADGDWQGIKEVCFDSYVSLIQKNKEFQPRGLMEKNPSYKQIIPYLVFEHNEQYFLMQRSSQASEERLRNNYTLGIGGHVRQEDLVSDSLIDWARREFYEEINYHGSLSIEPLGILNDDSNEVGKVHVGFVFLLRGDHDRISVKSELQSGRMVPIEECMLLNKHMETWSQMVMKHLLDIKYGTEPRQCCCK